MTNNNTAASAKGDGITAEGGAITFDRQSGISEEEQKEILAKINDITESRRRSLAAEAGTLEGKGKKIRFQSKKSGNIFPVFVNAAAIMALAVGLLILSSFQGKTDVQVRTGEKIYNSAERALIEEIRRETSSRLEAKEGEISTITSQMEEIDSELRGLYSSNEELTDEQRATETRLKSLHNEYYASLAKLQDERSNILEEARIREVGLQLQLESRTQELALTEEQNNAALQLLRDELDRQNHAATVEAQISALFANLYSQIRENRLDEASGTIQSMRNFLNTPAFQSLRSIQARKELYTQSVNAFEAMLDEARRNRAAMAGDERPPDERALRELQERNAELERNIEAITSQGSGTTRRITELQKNVTDLQNTNRNLETDSRNKDNRISTLQSELTTQTRNTQTAQQEAAAARQQATAAQAENATLTQTVATRDSTIAARESTIQELRGQISTRTNTINVIRNIVASGEIEDMTVGQLTTSLQSIRRTLNEN
jgi:chromosome segregation ATPase